MSLMTWESHTLAVYLHWWKAKCNVLVLLNLVWNNTMSALRLSMGRHAYCVVMSNWKSLRAAFLKFCLKINQNGGVRFFKRDIYDGVLYFFYRSTCVCVWRGGGRVGERTTSFVEGVYLINLSCPGVVSCYFRQETYNLTVRGITFSTRSSVLMIMHYYSCNRTQYVIGWP